MTMSTDHIREKDLERAGIDGGEVASDGAFVQVRMRIEDFDRLTRLARGSRSYWYSGAA